MIYIDPPYNTGNDAFIYPDKFSETKDEYQKRVGDKDEEGYMTREGMFRKNSRENGQYHSNWLNMMYPRLFLARNLLRDDGVIFVSIDDNEVHNLRLMMNEIFGEEKFKSGFDLNSPVEHQNGVYRIGNGEMALLIETVSEKLIGEVIQSRPQKVIALDRLFEGNDQLKTNTALQMKDANIDFKTI